MSSCRCGYGMQVGRSSTIQGSPSYITTNGRGGTGRHSIAKYCVTPSLPQCCAIRHGWCQQRCRNTRAIIYGGAGPVSASLMPSCHEATPAPIGSAWPMLWAARRASSRTLCAIGARFDGRRSSTGADYGSNRHRFEEYLDSSFFKSSAPAAVSPIGDICDRRVGLALDLPKLRLPP